MEAKSCFLRFVCWPHSLWTSFLLATLAAYITAKILNQFDQFLTDTGEILISVALGFAAAATSTMDKPWISGETQARTAGSRKRIRWVCYTAFGILFFYVGFEHILDDTQNSERTKQRTPTRYSLRVD